MYHTEVISEPGRFLALRGEWEDLLCRSDSVTIFQTWEWLTSWWRVFGEGKRLWLITVRDRQGVLVGAAPLFRRSGRYYRFPVREVAFLGDGYSDRQDFITCRDQPQVLREILGIIHAARGHELVRLEQLPDSSALVTGRELLGARTHLEVCSMSPFVRVAGTWEDYNRTLSRKFRENLRSRTRRMDQLGKWAFREESEPDTDALVALMEDLDRQSRKSSAGSAFYLREGAAEFMRTFLRHARERGWLRFAALELNGRTIAYALGFVYARRYLGYNTAFAEEAAELSPGKLVIHFSIQRRFQQPGEVTEYDLSPGATFIKSLWTSEERRQYRVVMFRPGPYRHLIRLAVFRIRPVIKRHWRNKSAAEPARPGD